MGCFLFATKDLVGVAFTEPQHAQESAKDVRTPAPRALRGPFLIRGIYPAHESGWGGRRIRPHSHLHCRATSAVLGRFPDEAGVCHVCMLQDRAQPLGGPPRRLSGALPWTFF